MQNPPPGQQNYGTPAGGPPPNSSSPLGGMDPKIAAAISYIWIVGVIFFILEKENKFVRFHALQSILFGVANSIILILLGILAFVLTLVFGIGGAMVGGPMESLVSLLVGLIWLLFWLIGLLMFAGLIFAAVKAYQGQKFKLPIIGNIAENMVNKP
ncbi:MAG TPA: DUF4870 domain-containing protein [Pyrinomonadaceae bacterium]|jgi:uncharacterized membrane protein|nr:DUF4870 domain-containing protein [Pyrinomonadaceae bacterium]